MGKEGAVSGLIWKVVNEKLKPGGSISRASIFFFTMNRFVDQGVLGFRDATGKGGHHRIYYPLMDEDGCVKYILETTVESMLRDYPEETREILEEYK
jgi:hypothetical protein